MNSLVSGEAAHFEPSMMVLHKVMNDQETVFTVDASADPRFKDGTSVTGVGVRSVICAPMLSGGDMVGAIYVDTLQSETSFSQEHRQSLEAIADLVATGLLRY